MVTSWKDWCCFYSLAALISQQSPKWFSRFFIMFFTCGAFIVFKTLCVELKKLLLQFNWKRKQQLIKYKCNMQTVFRSQISLLKARRRKILWVTSMRITQILLWICMQIPSHAKVPVYLVLLIPELDLFCNLLFPMVYSVLAFECGLHLTLLAAEAAAALLVSVCALLLMVEVVQWLTDTNLSFHNFSYIKIITNCWLLVPDL